MGTEARSFSHRFGLVLVALAGLATIVLLPALLRSGDPAAPPAAIAEVEEGGPFIEAVLERKAPEDFYLFGRVVDGRPSRAGLATAFSRARAIGRATETAAPALAQARWGFVGPSNIGGRVQDVVPDIKRKNTIYVGTASGGVWKSSDAGESYTPIWKKKWVQSIGALAMGTDGTLWAGTGETNPGGGSLTYGGNGVYRSTDRGKSWTRVGLARSSTIGRIVVDPEDPDHVLVAVSGNLFTPGEQRGLYETKDGGATWKRILAPDNDTTGASDVAVDPKDPKNILVTMWDHIRHPDVRVYSGVGSGIYRSTDGGKTFERLGPANGLPPASDEVGRIGVTFDPQDPQRAYAIYANNSKGAFFGWFISRDGGATWMSPPGSPTLAASQSVYGWWFARVWVDPKDSDHVFVAGLPLAESFDGGMSFPVSQLDQHVDHHAMAWDPHKEGRVYNGNDGGVYRSEENGADGSWKHGPYQPWVQFYTIDVSEQDPSRINGGLQDQGSVRSWNGEKSGTWNNYYGGDGVKNAINPRDKNNIFACSQYGSCGRSETGGPPMSGMDQDSTRFGWLTPIEFQPGTENVMYWAGDSLHRSEDKGESWVRISPDLGEGELGRETNPLYAGHFGTIQAVGVNKKEPETIYAGTDNGLLWKTTDLGESWAKIENEALPERWITHIAVKPSNPDVLYVSFSGYREGDNAAYVLRSKDGGKSWRNVSAKLPKAPVNDLVLVGRKLYAATDVGVFRTATRRVRWLKVGRGLPLVPVNDLRWIKKNRTLYAGTFGRGIYKVSTP